jgi:hypothetical protein
MTISIQKNKIALVLAVAFMTILLASISLAEAKTTLKEVVNSVKEKIQAIKQLKLTNSKTVFPAITKTAKKTGTKAPVASSNDIQAMASSCTPSPDRIRLNFPSVMYVGQTYTLEVQANNTGLEPTQGAKWKILIPASLNFNSIATRPSTNDFFEGKSAYPYFYPPTTEINDMITLSTPGDNVTNQDWSPIAIYNFTVNPTGVFQNSDKIILGPSHLSYNGATQWQLCSNIEFSFTIINTQFNPWCSGADMNHDGTVDGLDYGAWQNQYGKTNCTPSNNWCNWGDANKDGTVDGLDYGAWQNQYGKTNCNL